MKILTALRYKWHKGLSMGLPGATELMIVLGIVVLVFGGKKIPELMKGIGGGIKNFKAAVKEDDAAVASSEEPKQVETDATTTTEAKVEETTKQA
jgi:sec-independent protein translocase protein TatA